MVVNGDWPLHCSFFILLLLVHTCRLSALLFHFNFIYLLTLSWIIRGQLKPLPLSMLQLCVDTCHLWVCEHIFSRYQSLDRRADPNRSSTISRVRLGFGLMLDGLVCGSWVDAEKILNGGRGIINFEFNVNFLVVWFSDVGF